jgi:hypothetical protein
MSSLTHHSVVQQSKYIGIPTLPTTQVQHTPLCPHPHLTRPSLTRPSPHLPHSGQQSEAGHGCVPTVPTTGGPTYRARYRGGPMGEQDRGQGQSTPYRGDLVATRMRLDGAMPSGRASRAGSTRRAPTLRRGAGAVARGTRTPKVAERVIVSVADMVRFPRGPDPAQRAHRVTPDHSTAQGGPVGR